MLTGNETVSTQGVRPDGTPTYSEVPVKLSEIAALATRGIRGTVKVAGHTAVTVDHAGIPDDAVIAMSLAVAEGTVGAQPTVTTVMPGAGFEVTATEGDGSTYNWIAL